MAKNFEPFNRWLNNQSWHSGHHLDEARFYKATYEILKANDKDPISPEEVRDYIINQFESMIDKEFLRARAEEAAERFEIISDFVAANNL